MDGDFITVPKSEVLPNEIFYVAVYCENNCSYDLIASIEQETEILANEFHRTLLLNDRAKIYRYSHSDSRVEELEFVAFSPEMEEFKMYVTKGIIIYN